MRRIPTFFTGWVSERRATMWALKNKKTGEFAVDHNEFPFLFRSEQEASSTFMSEFWNCHFGIDWVPVKVELVEVKEGK